MASLIQELMKQIVDLPELPVFRVTLSCSDHSSKWIAWADLRADVRSYSAEADTPERALGELKKVLDSILCPYCHQQLPEKNDD